MRKFFRARTIRFWLETVSSALRMSKYRPAKAVHTAKKPLQREHPLQRALKWKGKLTLNPALTARALSKLVRVSETTMSLTLQLLRLTKPI